MTTRSIPTPHTKTALPLLGMAVSLFLWVAILTQSPGDWPSPNHHPLNDPAANSCGRVGAWTAYWLSYYIGDGAMPLTLFVTLASILSIAQRAPDRLARRILGVGILIVVTSASAELVAGSNRWELPEGAGGVLGLAAAGFLRTNVANLGAVLVLGYLFLLAITLIAAGWGMHVPSIIERIWNATAKAMGGLANAAGPVARTAIATAGASGRRATSLAGRSTRGRSHDPDDSAVDTIDEPDSEPASEPPVTSHRPRTLGRHGENSAQATLFDSDDDDDDDDDETASKPRSRKARRARIRKRKAARVEKTIAQDSSEGDSTSPRPLEEVSVNAPLTSSPTTLGAADSSFPENLSDWHFPSITLLDEPSFEFTAEQESAVRSKAKILERTLEDFRVVARVVQIDTGPVITMFELQLGAGVKVSQIAALSNDIARALRATSVRVVAPIPGKNTVGIEMPNQEKEVVQLKDLLVFGGEKLKKMALPLFLGKDASGAPLIDDLTRMPHLLIAGTTGSGKSVCINSILAGFLMTQRPDRLKLILADPKMVELARFKDIPHLICPIVTDAGRAGAILEWAVTKMEERYALLAEAGVRSLSEYNDLGADEILRRLKPTDAVESAQIPKHLPYLVIVIDELADLMMTSARDVEHHLCRLAQKSRAVGIHIIVATQRPEARVVTGLIKSNMPCRIAFRVASRIDSRIVLDQNGAEILMGQGDMLFLPPGSAKPIRAQGTFVSDRELQAILDDLAGRIKPKFHPELIRLTSTDVTKDEAQDPLFDQAVRIVLQSGRGSVSLIQRKLNIGYSRASRLIDQMTDAGIVGDFKGSQAREVLITVADWESIRRRANREDAEQEEIDQRNLTSQDEEPQAELPAEDEEEEDEEDADDEELEDDEEADEEEPEEEKQERE